MKTTVDFYEERKPPNDWWFVLAVTIVTILAALIYSQVNAEELKASWYSRASLIKEGTWKNGKEKKMAKGGSASSRGDGCAQRGKTKGKII
jgi:hypothetical protein